MEWEEMSHVMIFFTSLKLGRELVSQKMSLIGIIRGNRREMPKELRVVNQKLFESDFANSEGVRVV